MKQKLEAMEFELKKKCGLNYLGVRKAFLDLDHGNKGFISANDLAEFMKGSVKNNSGK